MKKILLLQISTLLLLVGVSLNSHATVVVSFDTRAGSGLSGPLGGADSFSGSFELDDTVAAAGSLNNFNGALDNFSITIGSDTFGGTDGRHRQLTSASGTSGYLAGRMDGSYGSTFGSYNGYNFVGMSYDFRGLAADFFLDSDPVNMVNDIVRNTLTNDIDYALMAFAFEDDFGNSFDTMRIGFDMLSFSDAGNAADTAAVPAPATLALLLTAVPFLRKRRLKKAHLNQPSYQIS